MSFFWFYLLLGAPCVRYILGDAFRPEARVPLRVKLQKLLLCTLLLCSVEGYQLHQRFSASRARNVNPYTLLHITRKATRREVNAAVRYRLREVHPDTSNLATNEIGAVFSSIKEAGSILGNPRRRRVFEQLGDFVNPKYLKKLTTEDTSELLIRFMCSAIGDAGVHFLFGLILSLSQSKLQLDRLRLYVILLSLIHSGDLLTRFSPIPVPETDIMLVLYGPQPKASLLRRIFTPFLLDNLPILNQMPLFEIAHLFSSFVPLILMLTNFLGEQWAQVFRDFELESYKELLRLDPALAEPPAFLSLTHSDLVDAFIPVVKANLTILAALKRRQPALISIEKMAETKKYVLERVLDSFDHKSFLALSKKTGEEKDDHLLRLARIVRHGGSSKVALRVWLQDVLDEGFVDERGIYNWAVRIEQVERERSPENARNASWAAYSPFVLIGLHLLLNRIF